MRKIKLFVCLIISLIISACLDVNCVSAKEILKEKSTSNIFGDVLGTIEIYDNGQVSIKYKYGLRKAEVFYCEKGNDCDNNIYSVITMLEANATNTYKNNEQNLATYTYSINNLEKGKQYKVKVRAYVATSKNYTGSENVTGSPIITSFQTETDEASVTKKTSSNKGEIADEGINGLMDKLTNIVNTVIIPIIYIVTGLVLVIKGALLGVQIVKSADEPELRLQKVHSLKWLVIGVVITYAATSVVGILTGYFGNIFN